MDKSKTPSGAFGEPTLPKLKVSRKGHVFVDDDSVHDESSTAQHHANIYAPKGSRVAGLVEDHLFRSLSNLDRGSAHISSSPTSPTNYNTRGRTVSAASAQSNADSIKSVTSGPVPRNPPNSLADDVSFASSHPSSISSWAVPRNGRNTPAGSSRHHQSEKSSDIPLPLSGKGKGKAPSSPPPPQVEQAGQRQLALIRTPPQTSGPLIASSSTGVVNKYLEDADEEIPLPPHRADPRATTAEQQEHNRHLRSIYSSLEHYCRDLQRKLNEGNAQLVQFGQAIKELDKCVTNHDIGKVRVACKLPWVAEEHDRQTPAARALYDDTRSNILSIAQQAARHLADLALTQRRTEERLANMARSNPAVFVGNAGASQSSRPRPQPDARPDARPVRKAIMPPEYEDEDGDEDEGGVGSSSRKALAWK